MSRLFDDESERRIANGAAYYSEEGKAFRMANKPTYAELEQTIRDQEMLIETMRESSNSMLLQMASTIKTLEGLTK